MEFNRHHYFMIGLVVLFIGLQVRFVQTYVLTDDAAGFVAKRFSKQSTAAEAPLADRFRSAAASIGSPVAKRSFQPPTWLGWALISIGAVLILHSLAMPRPD